MTLSGTTSIYIYGVTKEKRHITRYTLDPHNAKVAGYALDTEAIKFIFYNNIDENTTKTRNFITTIN